MYCKMKVICLCESRRQRVMIGATCTFHSPFHQSDFLFQGINMPSKMRDTEMMPRRAFDNGNLCSSTVKSTFDPTTRCGLCTRCEVDKDLDNYSHTSLCMRLLRQLRTTKTQLPTHSYVIATGTDRSKPVRPANRMHTDLGTYYRTA